MGILLYCIAKSDVPANDSLSGVAGDPVVRVEVGGLTAFTSHNADSAAWLQSRLRASALEFHHVLSEVFKSAAIVPFRFPTIFESEKELTQHLQERSSGYKALLEKFSAVVQMEIRVTSPAPKARSGSGAQYLKDRKTTMLELEKFEADLRTVLFPILKDWRHRLSKEGTRAFVLVDRHRVAEFGSIMQHAPVPEGLKVRVSGPWPVSEFIEES